MRLLHSAFLSVHVSVCFCVWLCVRLPEHCQLMLQNVLTAAAAVFPVAGLPAACCLGPLPFAIRCSLLSILFSLLCSVCSLLSVRYSLSGFTTRHSQSANPLAAAKLSLVVVTHCVLVMRHTQLYRLPLVLHAARLSLVACQLLGVLCQVSMSVSLSVRVYVCVCMSVFSITKCQTS